MKTHLLRQGLHCFDHLIGTGLEQEHSVFRRTLCGIFLHQRLTVEQCADLRSDFGPRYQFAPEVYRTDGYLTKVLPDIVKKIPPKSEEYEVFWNASWEWKTVLVRTYRFVTKHDQWDECLHCNRARKKYAWVFPEKDFDAPPVLDTSAQSG